MSETHTDNFDELEKVEFEQIETEKPESINTHSIFSDFPEPEKRPDEPEPEKFIRSGDEVETEIETDEPKKRGRKKKETTPMMIINGKLLFAIVDFIIPFLISLTHNLFSKRKIDTKKLKATDDQKIEYKDLFDEVAEQLKLQIPAYYLLLFAIGSMYSANYNLAMIDAKLKHEQSDTTKQGATI